MYYLSSLLAFAALVAAQAADPSISTPAAVVQCQPAQISFTATKTPVFISIIPGGQPSAAPLQDLGQQNASPFTWVASIAADTQITFQIRDSSGAVAYSAPVTIQSSSDRSCIGAATSGGASASSSQTGSVSSASVSSASSSSAAAATSSAAAVTSSAAEATSSIIASVSSALSSATAPATTSRATSSVASTSRTATATSAATSPSTTPNSARSNMQVGFAGLVGLAAAAVLA